MGLLTWQPIDEPCQLFFGDVGPTEVEANWLPLDDATESLGYDSLTPTQVNFCPKSLVAAPVTEEREPALKTRYPLSEELHHRLLEASEKSRAFEDHPPYMLLHAYKDHALPFFTSENRDYLTSPPQFTLAGLRAQSDCQGHTVKQYTIIHHLH